MPFDNNKAAKEFPENTVKNNPFGNFPFNTEQRLVIEELQAILAAISAGTPSLALERAEQITVGGGATETPTFNPSTLTLINRASNTSTLELLLTTPGGPFTFTVQPGDTLNLERVGSSVYEVDEIVNNGTVEAEYYSILYA